MGLHAHRGSIMKVTKLNGEVINIGDWDYMLKPKIIKGVVELDLDGNELMIETNPLPEGATIEEAETTTKDDGGRCLSNDHKKLRVYPSINEQLDYIYHNGIDAWKADMIKPVKDGTPKQ